VGAGDAGAMPGVSCGGPEPFESLWANGGRAPWGSAGRGVAAGWRESQSEGAQVAGGPDPSRASGRTGEGA
jgi:hypothetical protein